MSEPIDRELYDKINEIKVELGIISTKVDFFHEVKRTADEAKTTADEAKQMSIDNREDIRDMKANTKWVWGTLLTGAGLLVTVAIAVFT